MPIIEHRQDYISGSFNAMASPCEILIDTKDDSIASSVASIAEKEAKRIEYKYSRYRKDNIVYQINSGNNIAVDEETARLLEYADSLYHLSDGMFDITAGVLRNAWHFDSSENIPTQESIDELLPLIGWTKVEWNNPHIALPKGMEIDLGGIGKEYAVDRTAQLVQSYLSSLNHNISVLVNFGGDISVSKPENQKGRSWLIGVDTGIDSTERDKNQVLVEINDGGIATSGDTRRYLKKKNKRYGHVLNPRTGWPVRNAPSSVTVAANTCTDAGMLSTLALLQGEGAENFLIEQGVKYWIRW